MAQTLSEDLNLGQRLARARQEAKLNQAQLAEQIGVSRQTISNYERGGTEDVRFDIVARWAAATDVSLDYFGRTLVRSVTTQSGGPNTRYGGLTDSLSVLRHNRAGVHAARSNRPQLADVA